MSFDRGHSTTILSRRVPTPRLNGNNGPIQESRKQISQDGNWDEFSAFVRADDLLFSTLRDEWSIQRTLILSGLCKRSSHRDGCLRTNWFVLDEVMELTLVLNIWENWGIVTNYELHDYMSWKNVLLWNFRKIEVSKNLIYFFRGFFNFLVKSWNMFGSINLYHIHLV